MDSEKSGLGGELVDRLVNIPSVRTSGGGYRFDTKVNMWCGTNVILIRIENGMGEKGDWVANGLIGW